MELSDERSNQGDIKMACPENNLVWLDLEMTGLDPESNKIIEIATIITDGELNQPRRGTYVSGSPIRTRVNNHG